MMGSRPISSGDHAVPLEVFGGDLGPARLRLRCSRSWARSSPRPKPIILRPQSLADDLLETDEGAAANEEDVGGVDLEYVLLRVLSPPLRRHVGDGPPSSLSKACCTPVARHVAGDRRRFLAGLADLVISFDVG